MLFILGVTLFLVFCLASTGNALLRAFRLTPSQNPFLAFWAGLAGVGLLVQIAAFLLPLNSPIIIGSLCCATFFGVGQTLSSLRKMAYEPRFGLFCVACLGLALLAYPVIILYPWPEHALFDTELYHANAVRWLAEYGYVPGLGNLHHRLGQTSLWLGLAALMDIGWLEGRTMYIMPLCCYMGATLYFLYSSIIPANFYSRIFSSVIFVLLLLLVGNEYFRAPNLYYDNPALILYCVAVNEALFLVGAHMNEKWLTERMTLVLIFITASFMVKPLVGPTILSCCLILAVLFLRGKITKKSLGKIMLFPAISGLAWTGGNLVLSGYPVFPLGVFPAPFDWTMRPDDVARNRLAVQGWARMPGPEYLEALKNGISFWFGPWLKRSLRQPIWWISVYLPLIAGTICWLLAICKKTLDREKTALLAIVLAQLLYWFWQHPDYRFGLAFFGHTLGLALASACVPLTKR